MKRVTSDLVMRADGGGRGARAAVANVWRGDGGLVILRQWQLEGGDGALRGHHVALLRHRHHRRRSYPPHALRCRRVLGHMLRGRTVSAGDRGHAETAAAISNHTAAGMADDLKALLTRAAYEPARAPVRTKTSVQAEGDPPGRLAPHSAAPLPGTGPSAAALCAAASPAARWPRWQAMRRLAPFVLRILESCSWTSFDLTHERRAFAHDRPSHHRLRTSLLPSRKHILA